MIQAQELRIGDYLQYNESGEYCVVLSISQFGIDVAFKDEITYIEYDQFSPIPLTEEILLKCGFERSEYNDYRHPVLIGTLTLYEGVAELHIGDLYSVWVNNLHQLQNLHYALTGEELGVKL